MPLSGKNQDVGQSVLNSIVLYYNVLKNKKFVKNKGIEDDINLIDKV